MARGQKLERENFERLWSVRSSSYLQAVSPLPSYPSRAKLSGQLVYEVLRKLVSFF